MNPVHLEQYPYRCFLAACCKDSPKLSNAAWLDVCSLFTVNPDDANHVLTSGLTLPQMNALKVGDDEKLVKEGVLK